MKKTQATGWKAAVSESVTCVRLQLELDGLDGGFLVRISTMGVWNSFLNYEFLSKRARWDKSL